MAEFGHEPPSGHIGEVPHLTAASPNACKLRLNSHPRPWCPPLWPSSTAMSLFHLQPRPLTWQEGARWPWGAGRFLVWAQSLQALGPGRGCLSVLHMQMLKPADPDASWQLSLSPALLPETHVRGYQMAPGRSGITHPNRDLSPPAVVSISAPETGSSPSHRCPCLHSTGRSHPPWPRPHGRHTCSLPPPAISSLPAPSRPARSFP